MVGLLLLLAILAILLYQGWMKQTPPILVIQPKTVLHNEAGYLLQIELINAGGEAAAEVTVEGDLFEEAAAGTAMPVETSQTIFDYAPPHSTRQGALIFQHDPAEYRLELRAKSYTEP
jgi:uncharacterized protein (TIGR02588 family)